ncbi:MAG: Ger(x)C family spore germination protein [Clostridiaceae bacterium]|nr:Ger(x)C family spore germination protein [Clostridiaceae bacterium]
MKRNPKQRLKHSLIISAIALMLLIALTSCFDANEIDDMIYIVCVGVDRGVADKWRITLQYENLKGSSPQSQSGSSSSSGDDQNQQGKEEDSLKEQVEDQGNISYVTIDAPSFFAGIDMLNTSISRKISFMHLQFIVFSQELAKSEELSTFLAPIMRFREIRETVHIYITKNKAMDIIKANTPIIGTALAKDHLIWTRESESTGFFPHSILNNFYNSLKSNRRFPITAIISLNEMKNFIEEGKPYKGELKSGGEYLSGKLPRLGLNQLEIWGVALFDGDIMVGELNGKETRVLLILRGEFERAFVNIEDPANPDYAIPLDVTVREQPKIKVNIKNGKPVITVDIKLDADILAIQSHVYYENTVNKKVLEEACANRMLDEVEKLIVKCRDLGVDPFKFGEYASRQFLTIQELEEYNWNEKFKDATFIVNLSVIVRRTGTMMKSSKIISPEGQPKEVE